MSQKTLFATAAILAVGAGLAAQGATPDAQSGENFIEIPGVGRIPAPPGVTVFQQHGDKAFSREETAPKAAPPQAPKSSDAILDNLLARLKVAADEPEAQSIALAIQGLFAKNPSDTIVLLCARAGTAETAGAVAVASTLLDRVIALDPSWSEGFVRRARLKAARGDADGAAADLKAALRLEPRRFDALAALGALQEAAGDKRGALDAYRRALALDPQQGALQKTLERLRLQVEGRDI